MALFKEKNITKKTEPHNSNSKRKEEHLFIALNQDVSFKKINSGFEDYNFIHQALPETDLNDIDTSTEVFGKKLKLPLMISPLVGGIKAAEEINRNLAKVAGICRIAMGVGSQRAGIENTGNEKTYQVREIAPDILLFANLGAVQLNYGFGINECSRAINMIDADGIILHLNSLQEAFQSGGNHNFKNLAAKIEEICKSSHYPVVVREVGFGISADTAVKLVKAGVSGIDAGGAGGTSWIEVEKFRSDSKVLKNIADSFSEWGIPTAESIKMIKEAVSKCNGTNNNKIVIFASGGIRSGIDVAKAIALGADIAAIGLPVLKNIQISVRRCIDYIQEIETGLKIAMFGIEARNINELKNTRYLKRKA
ncbi:MAG: type 2 isopentenyl-diphosphate Delta-isomerase [Actinobacteria bacterium]|nr:type 2 isopentenyl-diphosphate Delta-isomerase [Actinomycetota bacterium]